MKKITIKSALMRIVAFLLLTLGTVSASAQYYMNVVQKDGVKVQYLVSDIDSVYFSDQQSPAANYEYVDLGLSVLWATCNVGATKPEEYGGYYAWGETETKNTFNWLTHKWCNGSYTTLKKYNTFSSYGTVDNKTDLDPEDDVARVKWGGSWRMPTKAELDELCNSCTWTWYSSGNTDFNGVAGYKVTSNKSGYTERSIFLPASGDRYDTRLDSVGSYGTYWSSSLNSDNYYSAWCLGFTYNEHGTGYTNRAGGETVRPVCSSKEWLNSADISLFTENKTMLVGGIAILEVVVKKDGTVLDNPPLTWKSDAPTVASVDEYGVVSAKSVGIAHVKASIGTLSAQCTVTVIEEPNVGPEYVDLGLSVKWATYNVGALSPEDFGSYYAWGETETKDTCEWSTYKWCNGSEHTFAKYNNNNSYGTVDNKTVLDPEDDVAHVKWGGSWRMPTAEEQDDLLNKCTWTWYSSGNTEFNGVAGYKVTSNKSGYRDRFIFLPAAGYRYGSSLGSAGEYCLYWSSSLYADDPYYAWYLYFDSGYHGASNGSRVLGHSVRPVCP